MSIILNTTPIVKPCDKKVFQQDNIYCLYDQQKIKIFSCEMFNSHYWQERNAITGSAQGRGTTWFLVHEQHHWVLRHYYRGGLIGKFNKDSYFFSSIKNTRAAQEFSLLETLQQLDLPAPQPIAYRVVKKGLFYHADLLSKRIEHAQDLVAILSQRSISTSLWQKIGAMIAEFHHNGIYHHDLNAHNILVDNNDKVWLIDFDRGEQRSVKSNWQQKNMSRLLRSFTKEKLKIANFHWQQQDWQDLLDGYIT